MGAFTGKTKREYKPKHEKVGSGLVLYNARTAHNMSQVTLANLVDVTFTTVKNWENKHIPPNTEHLRALRDIFGEQFLQDFLYAMYKEGKS